MMKNSGNEAATASKKRPPLSKDVPPLVEMGAAVGLSITTDPENKRKPKKPRVHKKKLKKVLGAPRRFKTAYIFFSIAKHKEIRESMESKASAMSVAKIVGEAWKNMSKEERAVWDDMAAKDKARYELEKSMYKGPWRQEVPTNKRDPTAPRRPCPAFVVFLNQNRPEIKRMYPGSSNTEIMRIISQIWHESPEQREVFCQQETKDRQKYKKALQEWTEMQKRKPEAAVMASRREEMAWKDLEVDEGHTAVHVRNASPAHLEATAVTTSQHDDFGNSVVPDSPRLLPAAASRDHSTSAEGISHNASSVAATIPQPDAPDALSQDVVSDLSREDILSSALPSVPPVATAAKQAFRLEPLDDERIRQASASASLEHQALVEREDAVMQRLATVSRRLSAGSTRSTMEREDAVMQRRLDTVSPRLAAGSTRTTMEREDAMMQRRLDAVSPRLSAGSTRTTMEREDAVMQRPMTTVSPLSGAGSTCSPRLLATKDPINLELSLRIQQLRKRNRDLLVLGLLRKKQGPLV